jgi:hypothetical protein
MEAINLHYFARNESDKIINCIRSDRQRLINMLMLDCGLRVSETVTLRYKDFNFKNKCLTVRTLKKRSEKPVYRIIPLSDRLYAELADYITARKDVQPSDFLFKGLKENTHLTRFAVNKYLSRTGNRENIKNLHPHALRHSFATQHITNGTPLENIKTMLGHSSYNTTLVYAHIPQQVLKQNIDNVTSAPPAFFTRVIRFFAPPGPAPRINIAFHTGNISIGRNNELDLLSRNMQNHINTLILGFIGSGKSHLLRQLQNTAAKVPGQTATPKILKFDDAGNIKQSLASMLLYLYNNDKEKVFSLIYPDYDKTRIAERITRDSVKSLCSQIIKITARHEYILLIDSLDNITAKAVQTLEFLKDHFIIIAAAREIKVDKSSFLWNFDIVKLKNLPRPEALDLIHRLSYNLQIDDLDLFKNHIYEQTGGNPRAIYEMCDRYQKEPVLSTARIRAIRHTGAIPEVDCTVIVLIFLATIACLRYLNHEVENNSFRFIGGAALVLLIISRYFMKATKRKYV